MKEAVMLMTPQARRRSNSACRTICATIAAFEDKNRFLDWSVTMNRKIADSWLDAFRKRDVSKLELADDFVHTSPFGEIRGKKVYLDLVKENPEAFFSRTIETIDVIDGGDRFAVRYLIDETPACDCIYIRNGKISKIYAYAHYGEKPVW
jgi:hypothetical protein